MTPRATYRLQLHAGFGFADAAAAVPYLAELGITHLYLSPVLQAGQGSTHGYDVVDPDRVSDALGGEEAFAALARAADAAGLRILLDIVPNHMSIDCARPHAPGTRNRWWLDVLENGRASYYAHVFDVDWSNAADRVLLPVLTERYGRALAGGQLSIVAGPDGRFGVAAGDLRLPLSPRSLGTIVRRAGERIAHAELQFAGDALAALPSDHDAQSRRRRHRDKAVLQRRLAELALDATCRRALDAEVSAINSDPAELDTILEAQCYRLCYYGVADDQLSYRRFFDVNSLVGIRNEDPAVFAASHARILGWLGDGTIDGVRVDHVDGLREPAEYLTRLREAAPDAWIVVEKILAPDETLPASWPADGTTGYEFADRAGALLVDPAAERRLTQLFCDYTGAAFDPASESRRARLEVMSDALHSEVARLTELAARACHASPACRDYTRSEIAAALAEILAGYPTYRTYLGEQLHAESRSRIATAIDAATAARPDLDPDLLAFLEAALAFELPSAEARALAATTQQVTGGIIAKGDEDTLLYRQVRLLSRCDVGADLARWSLEPARVHALLAAGRQRSLLATSTHDSKRSEDVRARIAAISEHAGAWEESVQRWRKRADVAGGWGDTEPDRSIEYALWQTLVGAWPLARDRAEQWALKAAREARLRTSWRHSNAAYEAALAAWIDRVYADRDLVADLERFAARLTPDGDRNALAQLLIKLTAPGVPDFYQGSELRTDALVDPDNRRPVDLAARRTRLRELTSVTTARVDGSLDLGLAKLWTIRRGLELRRASPEIFEGSYDPLAAGGPHAHRVFAFARTRGDRAAITIVPRLGAAADNWRDTTLAIPKGTWRDVLSDRTVGGGNVRLADIWGTFPIALLVRS